ncbi:MAG: 50S ribosomal protein L17 [Candidatus Yanofskybacteria bacterium]|nr:50S ribosomal protein L17 [Candidatus Yanofskybacteria bacterium]
MNHNRKIRKFGRETKLRKTLMRDLARALILHGKIATTEAKAKSLRVVAEKFVTSAKKDSLSARRLLASKLGKDAAKKLFEIGPKFSDRAGGYTRIIKLPARVSDGARMVRIEFVS